MTAISSYGRPGGQPKEKKRHSLKYFNLGLLVTVIGLGVFYLINISNLTVMGFVLLDLKSEVAMLASEKLAKEEEINRVRSYQALSARTAGLGMVAVGEIEYLVPEDSAVAMK